MGTNASDPISHLGLSCPSGGAVYVCRDSAVRFVGCCAADPCADGSGDCPVGAVRPASFDAARYFDIPAQACAAAAAAARSAWYTCAVAGGVSFLGCCNSDPCAQRACPLPDLVPAVLSDDREAAAPFLAPAASARPVPEDGGSGGGGDGGGGGAHVSKIIAGVVAGAAALLLVSCFVWLCWRWRRRRPVQSRARDDGSRVEARPGTPCGPSKGHLSTSTAATGAACAEVGGKHHLLQPLLPVWRAPDAPTEGGKKPSLAAAAATVPDGVLELEGSGPGARG
ncbi:hypothetical protein GGS23DRAFT_599398 [Durotheca rogersii]|uniref:uncharacterized protein n=1 Tax=Durotheca rogersii TaxID=419775 RepID=UPI002220C43E|nr:uncharacterized protein GGS23DRAFT_599398 [Durotheca rogersii]KAI5860590.1 hypothetical protein GGS23DRAFT_599398 [Durotheca rogersii]